VPPAPALDVEIRNPQTGATLTVLAKLDTGADGSVIPDDLVPGLGLIEFSQFLSVAFDGSSQLQPSYLIDLSMIGHIFAELEVIAAPIPYLLLGRDVLNELVAI